MAEQLSFSFFFDINPAYLSSFCYTPRFLCLVYWGGHDVVKWNMSVLANLVYHVTCWWLTTRLQCYVYFVARNTAQGSFVL